MAGVKARGYSVPSDAMPFPHNMNQEAPPNVTRRVFRSPDARVDPIASKHSPQYTQTYTLEDDSASSIWIKARRGSARSPCRQPDPNEDSWVKAMRGLSPDAQAQRNLQASSIQRSSGVTRPADPTHWQALSAIAEVKASSDLHYVQAQVTIRLCCTHDCIYND